MATIEMKAGTKVDKNGSMAMPAVMIPSFRGVLAKEFGVTRNFLIYVNGGLGDAICAEPSIRYACENFKDCDISIATYWPELYQHLPIKEFINHATENKPSEYYLEKYNVFKTLYDGSELHSEFIPHFFTHVIDYHSLTMFRCQLTNDQKRIVLKPSAQDHEMHKTFVNGNVLIHPGRTWQSRTIPADYWNEVIAALIVRGIHPVIVGKTTDDPKLGTVNIDIQGCLDLRNQLSIMQMVSVCQRAAVVLTNDSSPVHMAASGNAFIGMLSTVKRPDLLMHNRGYSKNLYFESGYRQENLTAGGLWETLDISPANSKEYFFDRVSDKLLRSWLLPAIEVADWTKGARRLWALVDPSVNRL